MKEFDLELAKAGHPVQTRDGRKARIICFDVKQEDALQPIIALVEGRDGYEHIRFHSTDGRYTYFSEVSNDDLVMALEKHEGWVNLYRRENGKIDVGVFMNSEREARARVDMTYNSYVATVKIEWEE